MPTFIKSIHSHKTPLALAISAAFFCGAAAAQDMKSPNQKDLTNGWSADEFIDNDVFGPEDDEIGSIENLLLNDQGKIIAVIAEVGGLWDIGDTHVAVPWKYVTVKNGNVVLPVTEDTIEDFYVFNKDYFSKIDVGEISSVDDDVITGPSIWKATDLLDDYVLLKSGAGYGYVSDLVFSKEGKLQSVIVNSSNPDIGYGYYAYPWFGYGYPGYTWSPELSYYALPYDQAELIDLDPIDYDVIAYVNYE